MDHHLSLRLLCMLLATAAAEPTPGRIPKVYNALITSNQNLEPSKAYPVYQPVLHDTFAFPFHPAVFYGDFPFGNGLSPAASLPPQDPNAPQPPAAEQPAPQPAEQPVDSPTEKSPTENPPSPPPPPQPTSNSVGDAKPTLAPPLPPNTQSPIPLNEFGLPSQVLPLNRFDPAFNGFTQVGPFTYTYPGLRFYDPYDPFSLSPYANLPPPLYRPLPNVLSQVPTVSKDTSAPAPTAQSASATPPPEPSNLNVLNYSSKDPAIPNVPPPPLPQGGLKSDEASE